MTTPDCARTREVAAELALGIAEGHRRAEALEHVATCASCRSEVDQLAATADDLLLLAPSEEPPDGFETAVLASFGSRSDARHRHWSRRRTLLSVAAAIVVVLLLAVGVGVGTRWLGSDGSAPTTDLATGTLTSAAGVPVGEVSAHSGEQSWLVVTLPDLPAADGIPPGDYAVECVYRSGRTYTAGTLTIAADDPITSWSTTIGYRIDGLQQVRLVRSSDGAVVEANITPR